MSIGGGWIKRMWNMMCLRTVKAKEMEVNYQYVWIPQTEVLFVKIQFMKFQCHINQYYTVFYGSM